MSIAPERPKRGKRSPFYWWRRFKSHKSLPYRAPLIDKIRNGDFDYPWLFEHADWELQWMKQDQEKFIAEYKGYEPLQDKLYMDIEVRYRKRYNLIIKDAMEVEQRRLIELENAFVNSFPITKQKMRDLMEEFTGSVEEMYDYVERWSIGARSLSDEQTMKLLRLKYNLNDE